MSKERGMWRHCKSKVSGLIAFLLHLSLLGSIPISCSAQNADPPKSPIATVTVGWTYLYADQGSGERSNLNGWFAKPSVTIGKGFSGFAAFTNYYGANHKGSINSHGFTFGVSKEVFSTAKLKPNLFAEAGDVRQFCNTNPTLGVTGNHAGRMGVPLSQRGSPQRFQFQNWF
jgi:hypothetical protein